MQDAERKALYYAREHAASGWLGLEQTDMLAIRNMIVGHFQDGRAQTISQLGQRLFDIFAPLNLDWQLVAQTEIGECQLQGFIASQAPGSRVKRIEAHQSACDCCAKVQGLVCEIVSADADKKNWQTQVWFGKSRIHDVTASAPMGNWPSAGLQHPGCRGGWTTATRQPLPPGVSKEFAEWMEKRLNSSFPGL